MSRYFTREGKPMTAREWAVSLDNEERRIAQTTLPDGTWISTVWLGLDHSFGEGPPLIFETCVFARRPEAGRKVPESYVVRRYPTEDAARAGHEIVVDAERRQRGGVH